MDMNQEVQVINGNDFALRGKFDGRLYVFEPNEPTQVPFVVAHHIFGVGLDRNDRPGRAGVLNRLGLLKLGGDYEAANEKLKLVGFKTGKFVFEQPKGPGKNEEPENDEPEPEQPNPEIGVNPGASRSPGGEPGAAGPSMTSAPADLPKRARGRPPKVRESFEELKARLGQQE
jgi:hypothetical protein